MKICSIGFELPEGKVKYQDERVIALDQKLSPKKITPFYVEFSTDFSHCDGFLVAQENVWDLLILDMEKLEGRLNRTGDAAEKELLTKCLNYLEQEVPLCDGDFNESELSLLRTLAPLSLKPTLILAEAPELNDAITLILKKSRIIFFYTADKKEVHAWPVAQDADMVICRRTAPLVGLCFELIAAGTSATVRGRADMSKGLVKLVDRDYTIHEGDIIEIRFNI